MDCRGNSLLDRTVRNLSECRFVLVDRPSLSRFTSSGSCSCRYLRSIFCRASDHLACTRSFVYLSGILFSRSKIRVVDVGGTTAFAQLPLLGIGIFGFFPSVQGLMHIQPSDITPEWITRPETLTGIILILIATLFLIWTLIWMFKALKISCNLKGARLGITYTLSVILGDIAAVYLIHLFYI